MLNILQTSLNLKENLGENFEELVVFFKENLGARKKKEKGRTEKIHEDTKV